MKRRSFIKRSAIVTVPLLINGHAISSWAKSPVPMPFYDQTDKILVLIQMDGGNDGLNTVIPINQYDQLVKHRSNVLIPENKILGLSDDLGFHPSMQEMRSLFDNGILKIIQNTGYPSPNRSHFRSTDIWSSGSPSNENWTTGWIGRYFDSLYPGFPEDYPNQNYPDPFAITIASRVSETCQGTSANYSMAIKDPANLTTLTEGTIDEVPDTPYGYELSFLRTAIAQTNAYGKVVSEAAENGQNLSNLYQEDNDLAGQLKTVAKLISGGLKTSIYVVRTGGFDTHANQVDLDDSSSGSHALLLQNLSDAISAFQDDLNLLDLDKRVLGLTFTEFGRQIKSNDSLGTDHGEAGPMFLFGSCVDPTILGTNPEIPDELEKRQALPYQVDFRNIYGSLLTDWFEMSEEDVRNLLWPDFVKLDLLDSCSSTSTNNFEPEIDIQIIPNPFINDLSIRMNSNGDNLNIKLFNNLGQFKASIFEGTLSPGPQNLTYNGSSLSPGIYYLRVQQGSRIQTIKVIKN